MEVVRHCLDWTGIQSTASIKQKEVLVTDKATQAHAGESNMEKKPEDWVTEG